MNEVTALIYAYARAAWRRRWWAVLTAWVVAVGAWGVILTLPDRYEASAKVYIEARNDLDPALEGLAVNKDYQSQLPLVREALLSRPQLTAVARVTNLDVKVKTTADMDALISKLQKQIRVSVANPAVLAENVKVQDSMYTITYQHPNRDKSIEVVQNLLSTFYEGISNRNKDGTGGVQTFFTKQIEQRSKELQEAEGRLAEFKTKNMGMIRGPGGDDYFTRFSAVNSALQEYKNSLNIARGKRVELLAQAASLKSSVLQSVTEGTGDSSGTSLGVTREKRAAQQKLDELRLKYTDKHSEVVNQMETVKRLEALETAELQKMKTSESPTAIRPLENNSTYQGVQAQLSQLQVEIGALETSVRQSQVEFDRLRGLIAQYPEVDKELQNLDRDYSVKKKLYEDVVAKSEQSKISEDAARTGSIQYKEIEPPHAAFEPVWPKRKLMIIEVLFAAVVVGIAVALLPYLLVPTFDDVGLLERSFGFPVLGAVSAIRSSAKRSSELRQIRHVLIAGAALVMVAGVLFVAGEAGARYLTRLLA
ncbi:MAG: XrtA system polysaccharide chain length determinant [Steroidobacteraceae bacterium]